MKFNPLILVWLAVSSVSAFATTWFVAPIVDQQEDSNSKAGEVFRELVIAELSEAGDTVVADEKSAEAVVRIKRMEYSGKSLIFVATESATVKARRTTVKLGSNEELDVAAKRIARFIRGQERFEDTIATDSVLESDSATQRKSARGKTRVNLAFGPGSGYGFNKEGNYSLMSLGLNWLFGDAAVGIMASGSELSNHSNVGMSGGGIQGSYYFKRSRFSPFVGADMQYGVADSYEASDDVKKAELQARLSRENVGGPAYAATKAELEAMDRQAKAKSYGYILGVQGGMALFRTNSVQLEISALHRSFIGHVHKGPAGLFGMQVGMQLGF